jgi:hypothetical protein
MVATEWLIGSPPRIGNPPVRLLHITREPAADFPIPQVPDIEAASREGA